MIYVIVTEEYDRSGYTLIAYSSDKAYAERVATLMQQPQMTCKVRVIEVEPMMSDI